MSKLEISRRCPACGASIRARAAFCPQCGKASASHALNSADENSKTRKLPVRDAEWRADSSPVARSKPEADSQGTKLDSSSASADTFKAGGSRATIHRATAAARDAIEENVLTPVKKLRKVSSVVLEDAAYDPSVRFVLVAAGLFFLFLVLLILSKVVG